MLVIFIVLCMVVFGVLSLTAALRDYRYSEKSASRTTAYYEADCLAEEQLSLIDDILASTAENAGLGSEEYREAALDTLNSAFSSGITAAESASSAYAFTISYAVPSGEEQQLEVTLLANAPGQMNGGYYKILSWKLTTISEWEGDTSLPVLH
jgi:hypothetical protein